MAELLREGPRYDLGATSLERHQVFLGDGEVLFVFEGPHAEREAQRILMNPRVLSRAGALGAHLKLPPRLPREIFSWRRPEVFDGVSFGSHPGPGDSDGG